MVSGSITHLVVDLFEIKLKGFTDPLTKSL